MVRGASVYVRLAVVAACLMAGLALWRATRPAELPSSYSTAPGGMAALYRLLARQGVAVGRRTAAPLPSAAVLVCAAGSRPLAAAEADRLTGWLRAGHEAVVLGAVPALARSLDVGLWSWPPAGPAAEAALAIPALRGAGRLQFPRGVLVTPGGPGTVLYTVLGQPAALELRVGRGRLYWFGSAQLWSNATLARSPGNLALAENLLHRPGGVRFDEYWFGRGLAPAAAVSRRGVLPPLPADADLAALALAAAVGTAVWAGGWRRHPVRPRPEPVPGALEPVQAYAVLLLRTGAGPVPAAGGGESRAGRRRGPSGEPPAAAHPARAGEPPEDPRSG